MVHLNASTCVCKYQITVSNFDIILCFQTIYNGTMQLSSDWLVVEEIVNYTLLKNKYIKQRHFTLVFMFIAIFATVRDFTTASHQGDERIGT